MSAKKIFTPLNFIQNEIQNAVMQVLGAAPGSPVAGQVYYDSTTGAFTWRNASAWVNPLARAAHTGTQLAATISDFNTAVQTNRIDQLSAPTASVNLNSQKIINLLDGTTAQDAVTFSQLQTVLNGRDFKDSVRFSTTANDTLSGLAARDGVTPVANDRALVKDQTTASANGIYLAAAGAWTRATDADTSTKVTANMSVMVEEGTANGDKQFTLTTNGPIVLGTTALVFATTGAGTTYTQGTGISISGSVVSIDTAVTARKATGLIGNGSLTALPFAHNLANQWVHVQVFEVATLALVECDVVLTDSNTVTCNFTVAPTASQFRVVVVG